MDLFSLMSKNIEDISAVFNSKLSDYEGRLDRVTKATPPVPDLAALSKDFSDFKSFVWKALSMLKSQAELLTSGLDRMETMSRRKVLLIHGLQECKDENLMAVVVRVFADKMHLPEVTSNSINVCHRLGTSSGKPRPIMVRFKSIDHRSLVWDSKTSLKNTGITISEFLTKARHQTFMAGRKHFGVSRCWTTDGRIIVLLPDKTRRKVESMSELQKLMDLHPSCVPPDTGAGSSAKQSNAIGGVDSKKRTRAAPSSKRTKPTEK